MVMFGFCWGILVPLGDTAKCHMSSETERALDWPMSAAAVCLVLRLHDRSGGVLLLTL